jgi:hypothetical protein
VALLRVPTLTSQNAGSRRHAGQRRAQLTHASGDMTLVYSRGEAEKVVRSLQARIAHRNRKEP